LGPEIEGRFDVVVASSSGADVQVRADHAVTVPPARRRATTTSPSTVANLAPDRLQLAAKLSVSRGGYGGRPELVVEDGL